MRPDFPPTSVCLKNFVQLLYCFPKHSQRGDLNLERGLENGGEQRKTEIESKLSLLSLPQTCDWFCHIPSSISTSAFLLSLAHGIDSIYCPTFQG